MTDIQTQAQEELKDTVEAMPTSDKPAEVETDQDDLELPDGVSERTREQFEKLKKRLADAETQKAPEPQPQYQSVLEDLYPKAQDYSHLNQQQVDEVKQQVINEAGEVDVALLNRMLEDSNRRAEQAERTAREAMERARNFEETQQVREAHSEFPELDPKNSNFDPKFYHLVKNELIGQMMQGNKDIKAAAKSVREFYQPVQNVNKAKEEAVSAYKQSVTQKELASASVSSGRGNSTPVNQDELVQRSIKGDMSAIHERLKANNY